MVKLWMIWPSGEMWSSRHPIPSTKHQGRLGLRWLEAIKYQTLPNETMLEAWGFGTIEWGCLI